MGITSSCKVCRAAYGRLSRKLQPERHKKYRWSPERQRVYRRAHLPQAALYARRWREKNRAKIAEYHRNRRRNNLGARLLSNCRGRLNDALKRHNGSKKNRPINALIGCTIDELKSYLESQFQPNMTWDNYGRGMSCWHIDHVKPCNEFNLADAEEQRRCFHYTNLQPLWCLDNLRKSKGKYRKAA